MTYLCAVPILMIGAAGLLLALVTIRRDGLRWEELFSLVLSLGLGGVATVLFWASLAGERLTTAGQAGFAAIVCILILWLLKRRRMAIFSLPDAKAMVAWRLAGLVGLGLVSISLLTIAAIALLRPVVEWDAFAIWALKARALAIFPLSQHHPVFYDLAYSFSHLDYPLLVPILLSAFYTAAGSFNDEAAKSVFVLLSVGIALNVFVCARRLLVAKSVALALTAILLSAPMFLKWAGSGYADIAVALYAVSAAAYFALYLRDLRSSDLYIAICHCVFLAFSKNEGIAIAAAFSATAGGILLFGRRWREVLRLAGAALVGLAALTPFLIWRAGVPKTHEDYGGRLAGLFTIAIPERLPFVLKSISRELADVGHWGLLWWLAGLMIILGWRQLRRREVLFIVLAVLGQFAAYVAAYLVSPYTPERLVPGTLDRLVLQAAPLACIVVAAVYGAMGRSSSGEAEATAQQSDAITR